MIERIMRFALERRLLMLCLSLLLAGLGWIAIRSMPIDAFPDVTNVQVEVLCNAPGLSPLEIERQVTYPVETAMKGLPGLANIRSTTRYGLAVVTVIFNDDVDAYFARQLVFERLSSVEETLPKGVKVEMGPVATAMGEIYQYTLEGRPPADAGGRIAYLTRVRSLQDWVVAPLLKSVPGVNEVNSFGGYLKEYQVVAAPDMLVKYGLSAADVADALERGNQNIGGGFLERHDQQFILRGVGLIESEADIGAAVVTSRHGIPIFVRDVALVRTGFTPRQGLALKDRGEETVGGVVMMLRGGNSLEIVRGVEQKVREINSGGVLPGGVRITPYYARSEIVGKSVKTVVRALVEGAILVLVVLYLLLGNVRGAITVLFALPLSLLLTFAVMKGAGLTANLMSLGGLAISIGMIIDAAIIQVENVQRHLTHLGPGDSRLSAVLHAVLEVRRPSIFGELIIAVTFLPILALRGMEGKMFAPLALAVAIALFASMLLSVLIVPALCSLVLRPAQEKEGLLISWSRRLYAPVVEFALRAPGFILIVSTVLIGAAGIAAARLGSEFMPIMDEGAFDMDTQLIPGASLEKAHEVSRIVHERLMNFPELTALVSKTGQTGVSLEARGVDRSVYTGMLRPREEWTTAASREDLFERMRQRLSDIPGVAVSFSQPIQCRIDELVAGTRAQVIVKLFGNDFAIMRQKTGEIAGILGRIAGASDVVTEKVSGQPYLTIRLDRERAARHGLRVSEALGVVELVVGGRTVTRVFDEDRPVDLTVRLEESQRNSIEALSNLLVPTSQGYSVPLGAVADIRLEEGPVQISREDGRRRMAVELNLTGRDIGSFVEEAQRRLQAGLRLPAGYYLQWGGQFENQQQAMARLMLVGPLAVGLILLLLFLTFGSIRPALLVFLNLPFALMGGVFALWFCGLYFSVPASVGFIVLFGVAVLNGLVLVSHAVQIRRKGVGVQESVLQACLLRLRPILMTASITVFSLAPLFFATGPGSEIQRPLAAVVVGGLISSTLATLVVLPAMFRWFASEGA
jgi:cobalt-zinc-cadmium resistance protein CzcA